MFVLLLVLVLSIAEVRTAIEYEYRFTEYRFAEYEYEKPLKTSIETPKHANSATSKVMGDVRLWRIACHHNAGPPELRISASI